MGLPEPALQHFLVRRGTRNGTNRVRATSLANTNQRHCKQINGKIHDAVHINPRWSYLDAITRKSGVRYLAISLVAGE